MNSPITGTVSMASTMHVSSSRIYPQGNGEAERAAHLSVQVEMGNNLTNHRHTHPADLLVPNWVLGKPAAFDLYVTSTLTPTTLLEACGTTGVAALTTELRKHSSNDTKCKELDWVCVPLVEGGFGFYLPACFLTSHLLVQGKVSGSCRTLWAAQLSRGTTELMQLPSFPVASVKVM